MTMSEESFVLVDQYGTMREERVIIDVETTPLHRRRKSVKKKSDIQRLLEMFPCLGSCLSRVARWLGDT